MSDFLRGYLRQSLSNANEDLAAYQKYVAKLQAENSRLAKEIEVWRAHYAAEESRFVRMLCALLTSWQEGLTRTLLGKFKERTLR